MAPVPSFLIRLATAFLTQALTRRLQQSPAFFRAVDRLIHEIDHLPRRMQGQAIPPYRRINPQEPTLGERAQDIWNQRVDDPGEPHDLPDPFAGHDTFQQKQSVHNVSSHVPPGQMARDRARHSFESGRRIAEQARQKRQAEDKQAKRDLKMDEVRSVLEKLRDERGKG